MGNSQKELKCLYLKKFRIDISTISNEWQKTQPTISFKQQIVYSESLFYELIKLGHTFWVGQVPWLILFTIFFLSAPIPSSHLQRNYAC